VGEVEQAQDLSQLTGRKKKLFELRLRMNKARKMNHTAVVAEKRRQEVPTKADANVAKKKRYEAAEEAKKAELEANGLDGTKKYLLDSVEFAAKQYKKADAKAAAIAGERSKQEGIAMGYERRCNLAVTPQHLLNYATSKAADPHHTYGGAPDAMAYGGGAAPTEQQVQMMLHELHERDAKKAGFSRRRKHFDERDVDSINNRNAHFNRKIERAFGQHTTEIKQNLERGTALPER